MSIELDEFNREVRCFCGNSHVVSRQGAWYDPFVVCSRGCFDSMIAANPSYFKVVYDGKR